MRASLLALLSAAAVSAEVLQSATCAKNTIQELVERTSCGCTKKITACLNTEADIYRIDDIEECYKLGGCDLADALVGATWFARECHELALEDIEVELNRKELKRAETTTTSDTTTSETSTTATKSATKAKTTTTTSATTESTSTSTTTSASAAATTTTTTSDSTTSASTTSSTDTTASSTTSTSTTASTTGSTTAASATTTGSLICSTTVTSSTTACSVSGGKTITCSATTTAIASCAKGNICFTSTAGADVCMKKQDNLTTSGLAVTITFAVAIFAVFAGLIIVQLRNSAKAKSLATQKLMADASMKMNDGGEGGRAGGPHTSFGAMGRSEADLPLINNQGVRGDAGQYYGDVGEDLGHAGGVPLEHGAPRLHPGLGALGQDRY